MSWSRNACACKQTLGTGPPSGTATNTTSHRPLPLRSGLTCPCCSGPQVILVGSLPPPHLQVLAPRLISAASSCLHRPLTLPSEWLRTAFPKDKPDFPFFPETPVPPGWKRTAPWPEPPLSSRHTASCTCGPSSRPLDPKCWPSAAHLRQPHFLGAPGPGAPAHSFPMAPQVRGLSLPPASHLSVASVTSHLVSRPPDGEDQTESFT